MLPSAASTAANSTDEEPAVSSSNGRTRTFHSISKLGPYTFHNPLALFIKHLFMRLSSLQWLRILQPRFLFSWDDSSILRSSPRTSWLDGLRGIAALQVYFFHFFGRHTQWARTYGSTPEDNHFHQLPLIRSIWGAGSGAVSTFFVISGYAITYKSLTLLRRKKYDDLYKGLCSSLFRRGFRLYLPLMLLAIPTFFLIRWVDMTDGFLYPEEVKDTWMQQLVHLGNATDGHINPFVYKDNYVTNNRYAYVPTSWTIPMEYYGSIVCYLMVMIVSRIDAFRIRCIFTGGTALYALHRGSWWTSNFLVGMLIADYTIDQRSRTNVNSSKRDVQSLQTILHNAIFSTLCLVGFYLAGMPPQFQQFDFNPKPKPGYEFLYKLFPPWILFEHDEESRWYWYWSGNLTFFGISQVSWLRAIFGSRVCQWLGKLSFSLYLVHAAVIAMLSRPLQSLAAKLWDHKGFICFFEFSIETPLIFVLSGVVERYIDQRSVRFAKWLEEQCFREREQSLEMPELLPLASSALY